jgi:hypothetical protein
MYYQLATSLAHVIGNTVKPDSAGRVSSATDTLADSSQTGLGDTCKAIGQM